MCVFMEGSFIVTEAYITHYSLSLRKYIYLIFPNDINHLFYVIIYVHVCLQTEKLFGPDQCLKIFRGETMAGAVAMAAVMEDFESQVCVIKHGSHTAMPCFNSKEVNGFETQVVLCSSHARN